jgi:hypothetical protein
MNGCVNQHVQVPPDLAPLHWKASLVARVGQGGLLVLMIDADMDL